jgi:uncharacterized protein YecT (DUF1311 family)
MSVADRSLGPALLTVAAAVVVLYGAAIPTLGRAEAAPADPIDTAMRACLARADRSTPAGQAQCMDAARASWEAAIDTAYRSIVANAPDKARRGWQESHKRWLAWREQEALLVHAVFATTDGSSYLIAEANVLLQPVRDRALQLRRAAAQFQAQATGVGASDSDPKSEKKSSRMRSCTADAACEHALFDLNRYVHRLRVKLPAQSRTVLTRAQRAWRSYFDATAGLGSETDRVDLIGGRVATFKRLSDTVGGD